MDLIVRIWSRLRGAIIACAIAFATGALFGFLGSMPMIFRLTALLPAGASAVQSYVGELLMARLLLTVLCGALPAGWLALWFLLRVYGARTPLRIDPAVYVLVAALLFLCGGAFAYFLLLPPAISLLVAMGGQGFALNLTVMGYTAFCCTFIVLCGALFNLPLWVRALGALGVVSADRLRRGRKKALLLSLIMMAILTPTQDAVTLLIAMAPLLLLYELSVLQLAMMEKRHG